MPHLEAPAAHKHKCVGGEIAAQYQLTFHRIAPIIETTGSHIALEAKS